MGLLVKKPHKSDPRDRGQRVCVDPARLLSLAKPRPTQSAVRGYITFSIIDRVRPGGRVIVPANTYEYLSYKKEGAELLLQIKGLHIEQPLMRRKGYVIGISQ